MIGFRRELPGLAREVRVRKYCYCRRTADTKAANSITPALPFRLTEALQTGPSTRPVPHVTYASEIRLVVDHYVAAIRMRRGHLDAQFRVRTTRNTDQRENREAWHHLNANAA